MSYGSTESIAKLSNAELQIQHIVLDFKQSIHLHPCFHVWPSAEPDRDWLTGIPVSDWLSTESKPKKQQFSVTQPLMEPTTEHICCLCDKIFLEKICPCLVKIIDLSQDPGKTGKILIIKLYIFEEISNL